MMTRAQRTGLAAVLGMAACFACSAPARGAEGASKQPITVLAIRTENAYDQADALTKALRASLRDASGWSLGEGDFSLEVLTISLKCSDIPDETCQARIAEQIQTTRYIWGDLRKQGNDVAGELHLWVRGEPPKSTQVAYSANLTEPNDDVLRKIASDALLALTGGPPKGSIRVRAAASEGEVFVDGKLVGTLTAGEGTFVVPAGAHKVLVKSPGFFDAESSVVVPPVETADVALSQMPVEPASKVDWRRVGGFVGIGTGVVFGAVGVISGAQVLSLRSDERYERYKALFPKTVEDVCEDGQRAWARTELGATDQAVVKTGIELCEKGDSYYALQYVFYPLAVFSAGVGVYLLATSGDSAPARSSGWSVQPAIGLDAGKLDVTYTW